MNAKAHASAVADDVQTNVSKAISGFGLFRSVKPTSVGRAHCAKAPIKPSERPVDANAAHPQNNTSSKPVITGRPSHTNPVSQLIAPQRATPTKKSIRFMR